MIQQSSGRIKLIVSGVILGILCVFFKGTVLMLGVIVFAGFCLWNLALPEDRRFLTRLFIAAISARLIVFGLFYIYSILRGGYGDILPDGRLYSLKALMMLRQIEGRKGLYILIYMIEGWGKNISSYFLTFYSTLLGYDPPCTNPPSLFSEKLINCLVGTFIGIVFYYIAKEIFNKKIARFTAVLVAFYPTFFAWSISNVRDPINILLCSLIILLLLKLQQQKKPAYFIFLFCSIFLLLTVRLYLYYIAWGVFGLTLPLIFIKSKKRLVLLTTAICFALIILLSLGFVIGPKYRLFNPDKFMEDAYITNHKILLQRGSVYHIYDDDFRISGLKKLKFIKAYLKGFFYFLFSPLPWQLYSARIMFIYPVVLIWHLIAPFSLCGIIFSLRHKFRYAFPVVAYIFLVTSAFGLVEGNIGATMRHRDLVLPFFFMLSIAGIVFVFNRKILYEKA